MPVTTRQRADEHRRNLTEAVRTLAWALETLGATYGIIGGAACFTLAGKYNVKHRITSDVDLIILPLPGDNGEIRNAETISAQLTTDPRVAGHFISRRDGYVDKPHIVIERADGGTRELFPIEIFDCQVWPLRRQYYDLNLPENARVELDLDGQRVPVLNPLWLLRQKIMVYAERQSRSETDLADVTMLVKFLVRDGGRLVISDETEIECLRTVLEHPEAPALELVVDCDAVFPRRS